MLNSPPKRFILPFSQEKNRGPFSYEIELAAVYALAEFDRAKGGGLVVKQPQEKLLFVVEAGYPLWLFSCNGVVFIFDGLNNFTYMMSYADLPTAKAFKEDLENHSKTREEYIAFLLDHQSFFKQPKKEIEIVLKGLIVDLDFKKEFNIYRKEAIETATPLRLALLSPTLEDSAIAMTLAEIEKLQFLFKEDTEKLPECLRIINKITSQYVTELNYAAEAVKDETNAKIRAQEEIVNPQIAKLNSEHKHRIVNLTKNFEEEIESLKKLKAKTEKSIGADEEKIKLYQREEKTQARQNHLIYEKRRKEKIGKTKKEVDGLKKELKCVDKNIKSLSKQKNEETFKLGAKLAAEIKLARQPLFDLESARDAKMLVFKQESERLLKHEKPVIEGLYGAIKTRDTVKSKFEMLGFRDQQLKSSILFYVPFYVICYQAGLSRRYTFISPSAASAIGFSAKLKSAFGMPKIKEAFTPRFRAITALIDKCQVLAKQDATFESEIGELGEKNNFLKTNLARANIAKGLVYLNHEGWLSDREFEVLSSSLVQA